uniref:Uncharacterized protein n=1 Tax=Cucumis melo TaxID=3656 RepID=A0A9I9EM44_CUCME
MIRAKQSLVTLESFVEISEGNMHISKPFLHHSHIDLKLLMSHSYRFIKNSSSHLQTREWTLQGTPRSRFNVAATETAILSMSTAAMTARRICLKAPSHEEAPLTSPVMPSELFLYESLGSTKLFLVHTLQMCERSVVLRRFFWSIPMACIPSILVSTLQLASGTSFAATVTFKSPTLSVKRTSPSETKWSTFDTAITCLIALMALKMATSTKRLCRRKALLSRICLSSAVLQGIDARNRNSLAHGIKSLLPSLPRPPPFPPQLSSSTGRGGKTESDCADTGGTSHVLALNP